MTFQILGSGDLFTYHSGNILFCNFVSVIFFRCVNLSKTFLFISVTSHNFIRAACNFFHCFFLIICIRLISVFSLPLVQ